MSDLNSAYKNYVRINVEINAKKFFVGFVIKRKFFFCLFR